MKISLSIGLVVTVLASAIVDSTTGDIWAESAEPVNGGWSRWSKWSRCSRYCNSNGFRFRYRRCNNPPPSNGGSPCRGSGKQRQSCTNLGCPKSKSYDIYYYPSVTDHLGRKLCRLRNGRLAHARTLKQLHKMKQVFRNRRVRKPVRIGGLFQWKWADWVRLAPKNFKVRHAGWHRREPINWRNHPEYALEIYSDGGLNNISRTYPRHYYMCEYNHKPRVNKYYKIYFNHFTRHWIPTKLCQLRGGKLAHPKNYHELDKMLRYWRTVRPYRRCRIGGLLGRKVANWRLVYAQHFKYRHLLWHKTEPINWRHQREFYIEIYTDGRLNNIRRTYPTNRYMCEFRRKPVISKKYRYYKSRNITDGAARRLCRQRGGRLAHPRNFLELDELREFYKRSGLRYPTRIGGLFKYTRGNWRLFAAIDFRVRYATWYKGQPNNWRGQQSSLELYTRGAPVNDLSPAVRRSYYICQFGGHRG